MTTHLDPCRTCGGIFDRGEMIPAKRIKPYGDNARGRVCQRCRDRYRKLFG